jgi:hypothetical protein
MDPNRHSERISPGADQQLPLVLAGGLIASTALMIQVEDHLLQLGPIAVCWH